MNRTPRIVQLLLAALLVPIGLGGAISGTENLPEDKIAVIEAPRLVSVASRKTHGEGNEATTCDLAVPVDGIPAVEPRLNANLTLDLTLVLAFSEPISARDGVLDRSEIVVEGGSLLEAWTEDDLIVAMLDVAADPGCVTIGLAGLVDARTGTRVLAEAAPLRVVVLSGDADGNGLIDGTDVQGILAQAGEALTAENCLLDIDASGGISVTPFVLSRMEAVPLSLIRLQACAHLHLVRQHRSAPLAHRAPAQEGRNQ